MLEGLSVNMLPMNQGRGGTVQEPDPVQGFNPKLPTGRWAVPKSLFPGKKTQM